MWLYTPFTSAPVTADSSSPCDSPESPPELSVTLSGTPTPRPLSWHGWKTRPWIERLFGTISKPSTAEHGAAAWISSLPVSHANRSQPPVSDAELRTSGGYGLTLHGSSETWDPDMCCWRTSPSLFDMGSPTSSVTLPKSGSMRSGVVSQRAPLVPLIGVSGGGASHGWPTPMASDSKRITPRTSRDRRDSPGLAVAAFAMWPTTTANAAWQGTEPPRKSSAAGAPGFKAAVMGWDGLHSETTPKIGERGPWPAALNPCFMESLMGLPIGWTDPVRSLTEYTSAVTGSSLSVPPKRSADCGSDDE